jgi:hypothetical protein
MRACIRPDTASIVCKIISQPQSCISRVSFPLSLPANIHAFTDQVTCPGSFITSGLLVSQFTMRPPAHDTLTPNVSYLSQFCSLDGLSVYSDRSNHVPISWWIPSEHPDTRDAAIAFVHVCHVHTLRPRMCACHFFLCASC